MTRVVRRSAIVRGAIAMALLTLGVAGLPAGATSHRADGVSVERSFLPTVIPPGYHDDGTNPYATNLALVPAPAASVLYGVDALSPGFVSAYDLGSLRPLSRSGLMLDGTVSAFTRLPGRDGLLVAVSASGQGQATSEIEQVGWSAGKLRVVSRLATPVGSLGPAQTVAGFGLGPDRHQAFVLSATAAEGSFVPGTVQLTLLQLANGGRPARVLWRQDLPDCQLPMTHGVPIATRLPAPLGLLRDNSSLEVGCSSQGSASIYKPPLPVGVGTVQLSQGSSPRYQGFELAPYPGDATEYGEGIWFPREDRLAFQTRNVDNGGGWVVFDGDHRAYIGAVPLVQIAVQPGADLEHGRLYLLTSIATEGLRTADLAPTPVDQGHTYAQYGSNRINEDSDYGQSPVDATLAADPSHHRLFVLYATSHRFVVLRDTVRYYTKPAAPNPDENTTNLAEGRGVTGAHWSGAAQGYGSVVRQVGGASNFQYNYAPFVVNQGQSGTQQLATSYLDVMQLTGDDARASAVTAAPDDGPTTGALAQAGLQWPYHPATCDDSGATKAARVDSAEVSCQSARGSVAASVVGGAAGAGQSAKATDVVVSSTALSAKSTAALRRGMTTTVTSVARGISILGGQLQIGQVAATATVQAGGRPGTAHGTYSRTVSNVVLAGQVLCGQSCDPRSVADRVNEALAGRAVIAFPAPDRQLRAGSPGGYQSLVRRDLFGQTQETQLNDQDPDRAEIPAMEITVFEDNTIKSRTVAYLAGVEAEAHYGIYRLSCATCLTGTGPAAPSTDHHPAARPAAADGPITSLPNAQMAAVPAPQVSSPPNGVVGLLHHGWQLLTNGISAVIRLFGVWLLLLAPVYLSARRWLLLSRNRSRP
jgi:hypothetical protein